MNSDSPSLVPLRHASLCLDCDVISAAQTNCIACGSSALLSIARTLGRPGYETLLQDAPPRIPAQLRAKAADFLHCT